MAQAASTRRITAHEQDRARQKKLKPMIPYHHPKSLPHSREFSLRINSQPIEVLHTDVADFAIAALGPEDFPATLEVTPSRPPTAATR